MILCRAAAVRLPGGDLAGGLRFIVMCVMFVYWCPPRLFADGVQAFQSPSMVAERRGCWTIRMAVDNALEAPETSLSVWTTPALPALSVQTPAASLLAASPPLGRSSVDARVR